MRIKLLGHSGLRVSEMCLGTMTFGNTWGPMGADREVARAIYGAYRARGGNFVDTANNYQSGTSESLVGEFIAGERDRIVLATKYTLNVNPDDPNAGGNHRKNMIQAVEKSLKRLGTDYIDLYYVHIWDFLTPAEEVMRGLDDLVRAGKIVYVGISDTPAWIVARCNTIAELRGWSAFVGLQIEYSLLERTPERDLLPMARSLDIGVTAWGPLASGVLSGKHTTGTAAESGRSQMAGGKLNERTRAIVAGVEEIAKEIGRTPAQVALNWLRLGPYSVIPILGARKLEQIEDNLGCLDFQLSPEQVAKLDAASTVALGFPHDFFKSDMVRNIAFGKTYGLIDNHRPRRGV
jgi:aryl-alcohol dehydrogenase-like predicted oxidoreductase